MPRPRLPISALLAALVFGEAGVHSAHAEEADSNGSTASSEIAGLSDFDAKITLVLDHLIAAESGSGIDQGWVHDALEALRQEAAARHPASRRNTIFPSESPGRESGTSLITGSGFGVDRLWMRGTMEELQRDANAGHSASYRHCGNDTRHRAGGSAGAGGA
jgi:hypothetical protein